jgi:hypothetical protein
MLLSESAGGVQIMLFLHSTEEHDETPISLPLQEQLTIYQKQRVPLVIQKTPTSAKSSISPLH